MKHFLSLTIAASLLCAAETATAQSCEYPEVLLVVDRSNSMLNSISGTSKWNIAKNAFSSMLNGYANAVDFGLMLYPGPSGSGSAVSGARTASGASIIDTEACTNYGSATSVSTSTPSSGTCSSGGPRCTTGEVKLEVGRHTASEVLSVINSNGPVGNSYTPTWQSLWAANQYFQGRAYSSTSKRYVILLTDGWQCCGIYADSSKCHDNDISGHRDQQETEVNNLRANGIDTFVIGFSSTTGGVDATYLNKMAIAGGTKRTGCNSSSANPCYYYASNSGDLTSMLDSIASIISEERCGDGIDNDCDGQIDEGCGECTQGQTRVCDSSIPLRGICNPGTQTCGSNDQWGTCVGLVRPVEETCNGKDDDCDGQVDENLTQSCTNEQCNTTGVKTCLNGQWGACSARTPTTSEIPNNGIDDDCNGLTDELCKPGSTRDCAAQCGTGQGHETCTAQGTWGPCDAPETTTEICGNCKDDNCNGYTDENCNEDCDGIDNDCNGQTDEGCPPNSCVPGTTESCGQHSEGECQLGVRTCNESRQWGACIGYEGPKSEICNNKDDDCNGIVDDGLPTTCPNPNSCNVGDDVSICQRGKWVSCECTGGDELARCDDGSTPTVETCNGRDDDCDGETDEGLWRNCYNGCGEPGIEICRSGDWVDCTAPVPMAEELCGDGIDNDCNGQIDDGCGCTNGSKQSCGTDVGLCELGEQLCVSGKWQNKCTGSVSPVAEICDGLDNDCNGVIDDNALCEEPNAICICGRCSKPCTNGECPGEGVLCISGYCIEDQEQCPTGAACQSGTCLGDGYAGPGGGGEGGEGGNGGNAGSAGSAGTPWHPGLDAGTDDDEERSSAEGSCNATPGHSTFTGAFLSLLGLCGLIRRRRR